MLLSHCLMTKCVCWVEKQLHVNVVKSTVLCGEFIKGELIHEHYLEKAKP